jgi:hypothetical protein
MGILGTAFRVGRNLMIAGAVTGVVVTSTCNSAIHATKHPHPSEGSKGEQIFKGAAYRAYKVTFGAFVDDLNGREP